jgi:hypothetical protein
MSLKFYQFICKQLLKSNFILKIENKNIFIECNGRIYQEPIFFCDSDFEINEIEKLLKLTDIFIEDKVIDWKSNFSELNILKLWYLITHEKYLTQQISYDKYGRVGYENVKPPFKKILQIPIADILSVALNKYFDTYQKALPIVYLTSDYDHLNIWDVLGFRDYIKSSLKSLISLKFKRLIFTTCSYLFSRKFYVFNGYLNDKAFVYKANINNIAFMISKSTNYQFDGKINYNDKTVLNFLKELKLKNVEFGLHTSFDTKDNPNSINEQVFSMQNIFNVTPKSNRHHYLRFIFPNFIQYLEQINIQKDFSLYYPESLIFRSGISSPFKVWNIDEDRPFNVEIIPTTLMDGTFTDYLNTNYDEALKLSTCKLDLVIKYSSTIVLLWHNSSLFKYYRSENYHPLLYKSILNYLEFRQIL